MHPHEIFYYTLYLLALWITAFTYLPMYIYVRVCVSVSVCERSRWEFYYTHAMLFRPRLVQKIFGFCPKY